MLSSYEWDHMKTILKQVSITNTIYARSLRRKEWRVISPIQPGSGELGCLWTHHKWGSYMFIIYIIIIITIFTYVGRHWWPSCKSHPHCPAQQIDFVGSLNKQKVSFNLNHIGNVFDYNENMSILIEASSPHSPFWKIWYGKCILLRNVISRVEQWTGFSTSRFSCRQMKALKKM